MSEVKQFYDRIQFPGHYTQQGLAYHHPHIRNPYLGLIDRYLENGQAVLDIGCGTGLITNLFAQRYPESQFTAIDFSDSIHYGLRFAREHGIKNVDFAQQDLLQYQQHRKFDVVICQGVLHHIPEQHIAVRKIHDLVAPGGLLLLGLYHPWGKIMKKIFRIRYGNHVLAQDQEHHPYETTMTATQVQQICHQYSLLDHYPNWLGTVALPSLLNPRNGGPVTYAWKKQS